MVKMCLYFVNIVAVLLFLVLQLTVARIVLPSGLDSNDNNTLNKAFEDAMNNYFNSANNTTWDSNESTDMDSYDDDDYYDDDYDNSSECNLTELPPEPDTLCCGIDVSTSNRIVGGSPTLLNQYPWLALIEHKYIKSKTLETKCGGSLISGLYVLTAAHCVTGKVLETITPVNIVLGDYNKFHDGQDCVQEKSGEKICSDGEIRIAIERTIPHDNYNPKNYDNDIALVKLSMIAPYTDYIRPICLPTFDLNIRDHNNLWLSSAGFGVMKQVNTTMTKYSGKTSDVKRHVQMPYVPLKKCKRSWRVTEYHICAGGLPNKDTCIGDSGGPLMYDNDGQYELVGAVSFGASDPCGKPNVPGVYTNVYNYNEWIMDVINTHR